MMKYLDRLEELIISLLIGTATIVIFVAVLHRYSSGLPIPGVQDWLLTINMSWAQELCIYMFVWMAKFGAAYGVRVGIHVGVDVLVKQLPDFWKKKMIVVGILGGVLFTGIIGTLGAHFVWEVGMREAVATRFGFDWPDLIEGPISPDLELKMWLIYLAIPVGSYLMCFRFLQTLVTFIKTGCLPHHDIAHVDGIDDELYEGTDGLQPVVGDHKKGCKE